MWIDVYLISRKVNKIFVKVQIKKNRKTADVCGSYKCHTKGCDETPKRQDLSARRPL